MNETTTTGTDARERTDESDDEKSSVRTDEKQIDCEATCEDGGNEDDLLVVKREIRADGDGDDDR